MIPARQADAADTSAGLAVQAGAGMPDVIDQVALARLYGEPLFALSEASLRAVRIF